jgi:hypothetical protein
MSRAAASGLVLALVAGCDGDAPPRQTAPDSAIPAVVAVSATNATLGHQRGTQRIDVDIAGFAITRFPITREQYGQCVEAKVCAAVEPPASRSDQLTESDQRQLPQLGVTAAQATSYCQWVGGQLPNYAQWLVAARGPAVHRFPWGDALPSCEEYHLDSRTQRGVNACCNETCSMPPVGTHAKGGSPSGVEDVLSAPGGELIGKGREGRVGMFQCPSETGCVARSSSGSLPSIDGLVPTSKVSDFAFRCVLPTEGA